MIDKLQAKIEENEFWVKYCENILEKTEDIGVKEIVKVNITVFKQRIADLKAIADFEANREAEAMKK